MSIPNIDFIGKLMTFLGLATMILTGVFIYNGHTHNQGDLGELNKDTLLLHKYYSNFDNIRKEYQRSTKFVDSQINNLLKQSDDNIAIFREQKNKITSLVKERDSLGSDYFREARINFKFQDSLESDFKVKKGLYDLRFNTYYEEAKIAIVIFCIGAFIMIFGIALWMEKEDFERIITLRQNIDKPTFSSHCQSCGKKFNSIVIYGTEIDDSKNYHFCKSCYNNGCFSESELTLEDLKAKIKNELMPSDLSKSAINKIIKDISKLDRWNKKQY